jgi:hypothetical protein
MLNVRDIVGSEICTSIEEGNKIFSLIKDAIDENKQITVSFDDVTVLTSDFVSSAIGQIYDHFNENTIREYFKCQGSDYDHFLLIKRVIANSKKHFKNKTKTGEK